MERIVRGTTQEVLGELLRAMTGPVVATVPTETLLDEFMWAMQDEAPGVAYEAEASPVRVLVPTGVAERLRPPHIEWELAIRVAELRHHDRLEVGVIDRDVMGVKLAGPERVAAVDVQDRRVYGFHGALDGDRTDTLYGELTAAFERADSPGVSVPPLSALTYRMDDQFGGPVSTEFRRTFEEASRDLGDGVDVLKLLLWIGGRHELRYDQLRALATETGLASGPTLTRRRDRLVEDGLLVTLPASTPNGHSTTRLHLGIDDPGTDVPDRLLSYLS